MQIVIDIPENIYEEVKSGDWHDLAVEGFCIAVKKGTILPKGHGRLIDAEQLMNYCQNQIDGHKYADCNVIARFPIVLNAEVNE